MTNFEKYKYKTPEERNDAFTTSVIHMKSVSLVRLVGLILLIQAVLAFWIG